MLDGIYYPTKAPRDTNSIMWQLQPSLKTEILVSLESFLLILPNTLMIYSVDIDEMTKTVQKLIAFWTTCNRKMNLQKKGFSSS